MSEPERTEDDRRIAEGLAAFLAAHDAVPESKRTRVTNVEKYNFPIGVDDKGETFPVERDS